MPSRFPTLQHHIQGELDFFSPSSSLWFLRWGGWGWVRGVYRGPLASPLQAGRVWHQHCSIITAKSCWWKTLGLLRRAISINIYARVAGNRMKPSFQCLWRETEEMKGNLMQIPHVRAPTQTSHSDTDRGSSAQECDMKTHPDRCRWCIHWSQVKIHTDKASDSL